MGRHINSITCQSGQDAFLYIGADGEVAPCSMALSRWDARGLQEHLNHKHNVNESCSLHNHSMEEILNNGWFNDMRESHTKPPDVNHILIKTIEYPACNCCVANCSNNPTIINDEVRRIDVGEYSEDKLDV